MNDSERVTLSGKDPEPGWEERGAPGPIKANGQHTDYWVLSEAERAKGFVRPVRQVYVHDRCGTETRMSMPIAETYARKPSFYGATFCVHCGQHLPVSEFRWVDERGIQTQQRLGS